MAQFKFPSAMALVHFSAYGKYPNAARAIPAAFKATTNVKSFLERIRTDGQSETQQGDM